MLSPTPFIGSILMLNPTPITVVTWRREGPSRVTNGSHSEFTHPHASPQHLIAAHAGFSARPCSGGRVLTANFTLQCEALELETWTLSLVPRGHEQGRTRDGVFQSRSVVHIQCPCTYRSIPACPQEYFKAWNAHDKEAVKSLHAEESTLKDWDASHGPTNEVVATGIAGIWAAVPNIQIEIVSIFECGAEQSCVAQIKVVVDEYTSLNVCDVFTFDGAGKVVSIVAYKA